MTRELCTDCTNNLTTNKRHQHLVQDGETYQRSFFSKNYEDITPYRCSVCESVWDWIEEGGPASGGPFLRLREG